MIPRVAKRGYSFKGAGLYYLHDKQADTSQRVVFTETLNLPMNDATAAMRFMAYTAMQAEEKKQAAGISPAGAKRKAGVVYAFSLSWHPSEQPDKGEMMRCVAETLAAQGLTQHEAVAIAHDDTEHPHIHVIVNLVHPDTGKIADLSYNQKTLSDWARGYERAQGVVHCPEREKNAERRLQGENTKYQDERHKQAEKVALFFEHSDSGAEFITMLDDIGLTLARGDKGRIVIVDDVGDIQNITRQLPKGTGKKTVLAKLADVDTDNLPFAADIARERKAAPKSQADDGEGMTPDAATAQPMQSHFATVSEDMPDIAPAWEQATVLASTIPTVQQQPEPKPATALHVPSMEACLEHPSTQAALERAQAYQKQRKAHIEAQEERQRKVQAARIAKLKHQQAKSSTTPTQHSAMTRAVQYCVRQMQRISQLLQQRRAQMIRERYSRPYKPLSLAQYNPLRERPACKVRQAEHHDKVQERAHRHHDYPTFTP